MHGRARIGAACAGLWIGLSSLAGSYAAQPPQPASTSHLAWQTLTRSVEDRVIEYCRFGQGERQVLVVAPLAGDEIEGVELAERLASHLEQFPRRLTDTSVTIVRDPNPDGRFRRTAGNAHGVLLDRNFRTRHWRRTPQGDRWLSGREPESEPETRALADLLDDLKPERIVILGSSRRGAALGYAGPAEQIAGQVARLAGMRPLPLNTVEAAGAFAAYAGADHGIATLIVRVPARLSAEGNWSSYKRALLTAIDGPGPAPSDEITSAGPSDQPSSDSEASRRPMTTATPVALQSPGNADTAGLADESADPPRILSAKDLEHGGVVVPIGRPPTATKPRDASPIGQIPPPNNTPVQAAARSSPTKPPGARLYDPTPPRSTTTAPSILSGLPALAPAKQIERLPPVDQPPPAVRHLRQEPIPFYPGTGF